MNELNFKGEIAKKASYILSNMSSTEKNIALEKIANLLIKRTDDILTSNFIDIKNAKNKGISGALLDRLSLDSDRIVKMSDGLNQLISLPDPIGEVLSMWRRPNGLIIGKKRVPLGVIGIIYEARPNVTVDAIGLCLKTGNSVILRGGSEAINSNLKIVSLINQTLKELKFPEGTVQIIEDISHKTAIEMMKLNRHIDVLIPRGGTKLIQSVVENATIPVIETGVGNCHIYVDGESDLSMAEEIIINAKTSRPGVCNAAETLLVDTKIASLFLPKILKTLIDLDVEIRGCKKTKKLVPHIKNATSGDWSTEYLDYILAVKVVNDIDDAINHINTYGTKHSEAIVTTSYNKSQKFLQEVDAAAVYVNASTRFTDGNEFGFGAEIGISTQKLHARGPMGLNEMTCTKYIIYGNGQIR